IHDLVIPPAWEDVWICPFPGGHIQATGIDQRGRKQYLYHRKWRDRRDQEKFDDMLRFARALPRLREHVERDLASPRTKFVQGHHRRRRSVPDREEDDMSSPRVLAAAVRLLDRGFFRIGSEDYAVENETYGLATMRKEHVTLLDGGMLRFEYPAKHGAQRVQRVIDPEVASVVAHQTKTARKRAVARVMREVGHHLGNTPAVARASYVDPRVIDRYLDGLTILPALELLGADPEDTAIQGEVEAAVLDLIEG